VKNVSCQTKFFISPGTRFHLLFPTFSKYLHIPDSVSYVPFVRYGGILMSIIPLNSSIITSQYKIIATTQYIYIG